MIILFMRTKSKTSTSPTEVRKRILDAALQTFAEKGYVVSSNSRNHRLEPDVPLRQTAQDLAVGRDTVLEAAKQYLLKAK